MALNFVGSFCSLRQQAQLTALLQRLRPALADQTMNRLYSQSILGPEPLFVLGFWKAVPPGAVDRWGHLAAGQFFLPVKFRDKSFAIRFQDLGPLKLTPDKIESAGENIRRVQAELYCEEMKLNYTSGWA